MTAPTIDPERATLLADHLRAQAASCHHDGSPLNAALLELALRDFENGGVTARLLADWEGHPMLSAMSMRLLGALHGLVLAGQAPLLATHYPSAGGRPDEATLERGLLDALEAHRDTIRARLDEQVQTNEVRRSVALLGGFLHVAAATGLAIALHEIGASAGLNQHFDRYRYALGSHRFGDADAELTLETDWSGQPPALDATLEIAERGGCDLAPIDLEDAASRARLESFIWGDQPERLERLRTAIAVARRHGTHVERSRALPWLESRLPGRTPGRAHVVFHSTVWWYLPESERAAVTELMEATGAAATAERPLAWLRMEGNNLDWADVRVRLWPGGDDVRLGRTRYHGQAVEWRGASPAPAA